jgi:DNA gyrase/topoisomerase IV subunit B
MYFNVDDPDVAATLAMQALCHAVDDAIDDRCTRIRMRIDGAEIEVRYDSGMPLDHDAEHPERSVAQAFLTIHAACHSRKRHLEVGSDLCQIGLAVLNAVCSKLTADIRQGGKQVLMTFERGELMEGEGPAVSSTEEPDETRLRFALDRQVLPKNQPAEDALRRALGDVRSRLPTLKIEMEYAHRD